MPDTPSEPEVFKKDTSRLQRLRRLLTSSLDPRAWAHALKVVNYYNYTHVQELRKASLGRNVRISPTVSFSNAQNVSIGENGRIGAGCSLWAGPDEGRIEIGPDAMFGPNVMVTAAGYRFNEGSPVTKQPMKEADVVLGRDVWVGYAAVILPGTVIGDGAIIGANAVVRGQIPENAIMTGNPAQQVGTRSIAPPQ
ncbi:hypothetical protein RSK20926_01197 [Roseobacter sp. SK209-2-6]|uniref:acyltransferase n=1 Tax=Roseobacter sp. SK209-2-6 TaxID=388739 RepID=UPI0000F3F228|nr:acyltransferase [Roseobacter sp. SK209-2-6]EBA14568.1 hypothetical protein RSK20926_01197 [Roseobacter sp. SK209-2-6]